MANITDKRTGWLADLTLDSIVIVHNKSRGTNTLNAVKEIRANGSIVVGTHTYDSKGQCLGSYRGILELRNAG